MKETKKLRHGKMRLICLLIVFSLFLLSNIVIANATVDEICFSVNHDSFMFYNQLLSKWETLPKLNTTSDASLIHGGLDNIGYYNPYYYLYNSGQIYRNTMSGKAIWYATGHGGPGRMLTTDSYNGNVTYISGSTTSDPRAYSIQNTYYPSGLPHVKLAWFSGCNTAQTHTNYGNLLNMATTCGVDAAVGFNSTIYNNPSKYFSSRVLCYYGSDSNNTLSASVGSSIQDTYNAYGYYGGVDSCVIAGNGGIKIAPASYGQ